MSIVSSDIFYAKVNFNFKQLASPSLNTSSSPLRILVTFYRLVVTVYSDSLSFQQVFMGIGDIIVVMKNMTRITEGIMNVYADWNLRLGEGL